MRKPMPLNWIEEAEARQVLTTALGDAPPPAARAAAPGWPSRLRRWFAAAATNRRWIKKAERGAQTRNSVIRLAARPPR